MILRDIATERKALCMKLKNSHFLNSMAHGIKCTLPPARYRLKENIYVGVCIDTACSLGMCAERNALANMITNGENSICKVLAIGRDGGFDPESLTRSLLLTIKLNGQKQLPITAKMKRKARATPGVFADNVIYYIVDQYSFLI